jgi:hypothetical protein
MSRMLMRLLLSRAPCAKPAYGTDRPQCASTLVGTTRLAFPEQLIEISFTVVLQENKR